MKKSCFEEFINYWPKKVKEFIALCEKTICKKEAEKLIKCIQELIYKNSQKYIFNQIKKFFFARPNVDIEGLLQDIYIKFCKTLNNIDKIKALKYITHYLYIICQNICNDKLTDIYKEKIKIIQDDIEKWDENKIKELYDEYSISQYNYVSAWKDIMDAFYSVLENLHKQKPKKEYLTLCNMYIEGYSQEEIANSLNISQSEIAKRLGYIKHHAIEYLKNNNC